MLTWSRTRPRREPAGSAWPIWSPLIPPGVIHGDAHLGNLIASQTGPVLCDFDATSIGPREWDLTPAAVGTLRFDYHPEVHTRPVRRLRLDVTTWPGFPALRASANSNSSPASYPSWPPTPPCAPNGEHRLDTFRDEDFNAPWTPYADLRT